MNSQINPERLKGVHVKVFLRSLLIQSSLNFWRMQNLGFAFSMIPIVRKLGQDRQQISNMLLRYLQFFNTHPYMSTPIIGSVLKIEEDLCKSGNCPEADRLKNVLMGPYAGIGDTFFWGSLKPFSSIAGVALAIKGLIIAPLFLLLIYNPVHMWVRLKGFLEGYNMGESGVESIRMMDLPRMARITQWTSVIFLGILSCIISDTYPFTITSHLEIPPGFPALFLVLLCFYLIKNGLSQLYILYGMVVLFFVMS